MMAVQVERGKRELACQCAAEVEVALNANAQRYVVRCANCHLTYSHGGRSSGEQLQHYREQYWEQFAEEQKGAARDNIFYHVLDWIEQYYPTPGRLVDVGCGPGGFLRLCQERGWYSMGYDPSPQAVGQARAIGLDAAVGHWPPCPLAVEHVDVVTMINVLDHLVDPIGGLEEAWRILKPGGLLYIRVPNAARHIQLVKYLTHVGLGHLPIIHLHGFAARTFAYHLSSQGFVIESIQTAPPSQHDPYVQSSLSGGTVRAILKEVDRWGYAMSRKMGLDRKALGLSLEVLARKPIQRGRE